MASVSTWTSVPAEFLSQTTVASDLIVTKMEDYLIKVFGYPKAFLMVLAKASFGRQPIPIVNYESFFTKTWKFLKEVEDIMNIFASTSSEVTISTGNMTCYQHKGTQTDNEEKENSFVQITANTDEINRRVNAFIQRKRQEVDAYNRREFCLFRDDKEESTCARTDAAFVPRHGKKSLMKTYRVYNKTDTLRNPRSSYKSRRIKGIDNVWEACHPSTALALKHIPAETYERIENLDEHLFSRPIQERQEDKDQSKFPVLEKIKVLEDRVLYLEGLSPEYFSQDTKEMHCEGRKQSYRIQQPESNQDALKDTALMDKRINELRDILQSKTYSSSKT